MVETRALSRRFGSRWVLDDVSLSIERGSVFALLGLNGAGKTTLLQILVGRLRPSSGSFSLLGKTLPHHLVELRERVGYVAEERHLCQWMTVAEIVRFVRSFQPRWNDRKVADLVRRFDLRPEQRVHQLSRGHRACLSLLLAVGHEPEILLLDEPISGPYPLAHHLFMETLIAEAAEGRTILFSSHLVADVERIADHVGILNDGRLVESGSIEAVKRRFRRVRVARSGPLDPAHLPGLVATTRLGGDLFLTFRSPADNPWPQAGPLGTRPSDVVPMSLEDVFLASVRDTPVREGTP